MTTKPKKPIYKRGWFIALAIFFALVIIGGIAGGGQETKEDTTAEQTTSAEAAEPQSQEPAPAPAEESESVPAWKDNDQYREVCEGETKIDPAFQAAADAVAIPEGGHVQQLWLNRDSVVARVCSPIAGDALREVAERLAIEIKKTPEQAQVTTMSVHAWPDDEAPEARLREKDFQVHLHDGGAAFENGAYRGGWEAVGN